MSDKRTTRIDLLKGRIVTTLFRFYGRLIGGTGHVVELLFFRRQEWRAVRQFLESKQGDLVLDIACGGGLWAKHMAETGARVIGLDIDFESLRYAVHQGAAKKDQMHFVCADATAMPFRTESFDGAFSICSLEHFSDDNRALKELTRVLKRGATAALTVDSLSYPRAFTPEQLALHAKKHYVLRCYTTPTLTKKAEDAGLAIEQNSYLVNSPISSYLFTRNALWNIEGHENRIAILFPLVYPIALISDAFWAIHDLGQILAVKLRRM